MHGADDVTTRHFKSQENSLIVCGPQIDTLFTTEGWSAQPCSTNFAQAPMTSEDEEAAAFQQDKGQGTNLVMLLFDVLTFVRLLDLGHHHGLLALLQREHPLRRRVPNSLDRFRRRLPRLPAETVSASGGRFCLGLGQLLENNGTFRNG